MKGRVERCEKRYTVRSPLRAFLAPLCFMHEAWHLIRLAFPKRMADPRFSTQDISRHRKTAAGVALACATHRTPCAGKSFSVLAIYVRYRLKRTSVKEVHSTWAGVGFISPTSRGRSIDQISFHGTPESRSGDSFSPPDADGVSELRREQQPCSSHRQCYTGA